MMKRDWPFLGIVVGGTLVLTVFLSCACVPIPDTSRAKSCEERLEQLRNLTRSCLEENNKLAGQCAKKPRPYKKEGPLEGADGK